MKKKKQNHKRKQIISLLNESTTSFEIECCICMEKYKSDSLTLDEESIEDGRFEFANEIYDVGWRDSTSEVFGHQGIHCPICHKNRNNEKHFEQ